MRRRNFLSLFLLAPASVLAEEGLLIDRPEVPHGLLMDHPDGDVSGLLMDIPEEVVESQKRVTVHLYSPKTWTWPPCESAIRELKDHPGIDLVIHEDDKRPDYFLLKNWPILHWGPGDKWQEGWNGKSKFLAKLLDDESTPPTSKPITVKESRGNHWSVAGDWSPSELKVENHLVHTHGFRRERIVALGLGQLLTLHDYVHQGKMNKNSALQPTKMCPT